ncbi:hypothetical protein [Nocardioides sp.]|uniref:hypothetical protein n=1 Tax=Nocardioides sp. TaxID=35761 RepID=UPI002ED95B06
MRRTRGLGTLLVALAVAVAASVPAGAAPAEPDPAPVAADDVLVITPMIRYRVDVLANDGGGDPAGADLQVCRFDPVGDGLDASITWYDTEPSDPILFPDSTYLDIRTTAPLPVGERTIAYAACDRHHTAWATLTLSVRRVGAERVPGAPTSALFTNPLDGSIVITWHGADGDSDRLSIPAGETRQVEVGADAVDWTAGAWIGNRDNPTLDSGTIPAVGAAGAAPSDPSAQSAESGADLPGSEAVDTTPPAVGPDHLTLEYNGRARVDVLANDSDDHPEDLQICRVDPPPMRLGPAVPPLPTWVGDASDRRQVIDVATRQTPGGTYDVRYYACDREQLTPGILTVTVRDFPRPLVDRVDGRPGLVRVRNRGYRTINVRYVRGGAVDLDWRHLRVRPHRTGTIRVPYNVLVYHVHTKIGLLTVGTVRHVQGR